MVRGEKRQREAEGKNYKKIKQTKKMIGINLELSKFILSNYINYFIFKYIKCD